jgi:hypothetical protein
VTELEQWVEQLATAGPQERVQAEFQLRGRGAEATAAVRKALEREIPGSWDAPLTFDPLLKLAAFVSEQGDPHSLLLLLRITELQSRRYHPGLDFLSPRDQLLEKLEARADADDCAALVAALEHFRNQPSLVMPMHPKYLSGENARRVAQTILHIAKRDPKKELRPALAYLRFRPLMAPIELVGLYKRLKHALGGDDLPIPVTTAQTTESLPIPIQSKETP